MNERQMSVGESSAYRPEQIDPKKLREVQSTSVHGDNFVAGLERLTIDEKSAVIANLLSKLDDNEIEIIKEQLENSNG